MKYSLSADLARTELLKREPAEVARRSGGLYEAESNRVSLQVGDLRAAFDFGTGELVWTGHRSVDPFAAVPVLHYLLQASGSPPSGDFRPYRDLWGAKAQSGPFIARPEAQLAAAYGAAPAALLVRARALGAEVSEEPSGDARLELSILPNIPLAVLVYAADEDFPSEAKILFDAVVSEYLPTEDTIWLAEQLAEWLTE